MNFKTTLVLLVLVVAGGVLCLLDVVGSSLQLVPRPPEAVDEGTLSTLKDELTTDKIKRIEIKHGAQDVVLERRGGEWALKAGNWPIRKPEVEELVGLLGSLRSRFAPIHLDDPPDLKSYGLEPPSVTVTLRAGDKEHRLAFGEESGDSNRFSWPTYLRLDDKPEVVRLAPGLLNTLKRPQDYYQERRLFRTERVAKEGDSQEKVDRLAAQAVTAKGTGGTYALEREGQEWELHDPVHDHPDPDKLQTILTAAPDIWAEQFVNKPKKDSEYGLDKPEQTLSVTGTTGQIKLLIGKRSQTKTRKVMRPAPNFGGPPMPPQPEEVHEEYRFAKLQGNPQVFEIKADKLKDVFVPPDTLRDARLARFKTEDARRVEVSHAGHDIVLVKDKERWRVSAGRDPKESQDAESSKVTELLDKLSGLQARDKDIIDKADPKSYGLDKPSATIKVTVETKPSRDADKNATEEQSVTKKTYTFAIGKHDTDKSKLYVRLEGWDRINAVEDSLLKLVERPALAYRDRRILDFSSADLAKIEVTRGGAPFTLEQVKGTWRLAAPVQADVDSSKAGQLAGDLGRLEAVEYVSETAQPDDLEKLYGLAKPTLAAKVTFSDAKKPAQTLLIGKQRSGTPEYFAKLDSAPGVCAVKKDIHDALDQDSLAYRPLQLWQLPAEDIQEIRVLKEAPEYHLKREGQSWKITGPFEATATASLAKPMADELANLRCERYAAHAAKDLSTYGLDKPYLRLAFSESPLSREPKASAADAKKEHVLLIGKPSDKDTKVRYAKRGDSEAVFVVGEKVVSALDHSALDLLNRELLTLDTKTIQRIRSHGPGGPLTLQRQGEEWRVLESPAAPFPADSETIAAVLGVWSKLEAQRFAAYGPKADLAMYGLDKPPATVTVTLQSPTINGKPAKPVEHTLVLGKAPDGSSGERYAKLDNGPGVLVLASSVVSELTHGYLDFVNRSVLKLDASRVTAVQRRMGDENLEVAKGDNGWHLLKPSPQQADGPTLDSLVEQLAALHAKRVAAYPAKDLQVFGLDAPRAVVTLRLAASSRDAQKDASPSEHVLKIGRRCEETTTREDRFALVDNSTAVVVLPGTLAQQLLTPPLQFRDKNLPGFPDADRAIFERGPRKAVFARVDGTWKLTAPVEAEAEQTDLEDLLKLFAHLRADELVADKPSDLKTYGLDRPEAHWRFSAGEKEVLNLLIGAREKVKGQGKETEGPRGYAKLANSDLVFLLSPELTAKVLGEYRSRSLWASLDATQIERLSYANASNPFALEKVGNDWQVAGVSGSKVKPDVIRDVLDALAGLKAARYVVDKVDNKADLKLYGLEPPQLVLEIQTTTGKRVLHIGRPEGESKRYYARVPDNDHSPVFVIAEADAHRIVRALKDFSAAADKTRRIP